jgi:hypothetical protein
MKRDLWKELVRRAQRVSAETPAEEAAPFGFAKRVLDSLARERPGMAHAWVELAPFVRPALVCSLALSALSLWLVFHVEPDPPAPRDMLSDTDRLIETVVFND